MTTPRWLAAQLDEPCVIYPRVETGRDEYNAPVYGDGPPVDTFCFIQPVSQEEIQDGRAEVGQFLVHLDADTPVVASVDGFSRLEVGGISYEVVGPPAVYRSLTHRDVHHVELIAQRSSA